MSALDLVEALATGYGVVVRDDGSKSVWFTLGGAPEPSAPGWPFNSSSSLLPKIVRQSPCSTPRLRSSFSTA